MVSKIAARGLLLSGVERDRIIFDRFTGYRTKPGQDWAVPVWEFAAKAR